MILRTLTPILSLIIAFLIGIFFIQPNYLDIQSTKATIEEFNTAISQFENYSALLNEKLAVKKNASPADNIRLEQIVPESVDDAHILVDLEALAHRHNLLFGNVNVTGGREVKHAKKDDVSNSVEQVSADLQEIDISFSIIGTYEQFKAFAEDIEKSATLLEVTKLSTMPSEDSIFQQFAISLRTYALPETVIP